MAKCPNPNCGAELTSVISSHVPENLNSDASPSGTVSISECPSCGHPLPTVQSKRRGIREGEEIRVIHHRENVIGKRR